MNNEKTTIYLSQGGLRLSMDVTVEIANKMAEIEGREPKQDWSLKGLDLLKAAREELKAEGKLPESK